MSNPTPEVLPATASAEPDVSTTSEPVEVVDVAEVPLSTTTEVSSDVADLTAIADAASQLGGDSAPIVAIILAAMAILGGGKAWGFYRERAEQKHALEMEKLKLQAVSPSSRPPSCKQAQVQVDERLDDHDRKISKLERQSLELGDLDGDDVLRRIKKVERLLADLKSDD